MLLSGTMLRAEHISYVMRVTMTDGSVKSFLLTDRPVVSVDEKTVDISSNTISASYKASDIKDYTFVDGSKTVIEDTPADELTQNLTVKCLDGVHVSVRGVDTPVRVQVFSIAGAKVQADLSQVSDGVDIDLSQLAPGVYVIDINGKDSFKIQKR